jgi:polyphenol oxidase
MLHSSPLLTAAGFTHGFSLRREGETELDFAILRNGRHLAEARLAAVLGLDLRNLYQTKQVHGTHIITAEGVREKREIEEADGVFSRAGSGAAAAIRVADCVPILVGDRETGDAWALHAGWRGVEQNIVHAALHGRNLRAMVCAVGPCIGPCCFQVGDDVATRIVLACDESIVVKREQTPDGPKAWLDLRKGVRVQLARLGVENVETVGGCSVCEPEKYHSYRRDGDPSGRMIAVIRARE